MASRPPKPVAVTLWLALFFPVGLNLLWRHTTWSLQTKKLATGATAVWVIICLISSAAPPSPTTPPLAVVTRPMPAAQTKSAVPAQAKAETAEVAKEDAKTARANAAYDAASARAFARYKSDLRRYGRPASLSAWRPKTHVRPM